MYRRMIPCVLLVFIAILVSPARATERPAPLYMCGTWLSTPPPEVGLYDVYLPYGGETGGYLGPSDTLRQIVIRAGGTIVHEFNFPAVRAEVRVSNVAGTLPNGGYILTVDDPNQYPVDAFVGFQSAVTDTDRVFLTSLGATIVDEFGFGAAVEAIVPDEAIPTVRANPRVKYVEPAIYCFDAVRSTTWGHVKSLYR